jgi:uncharacterized membrane protein HdeD (DUF308 family)
MINGFLLGMIATASFTATLFFLRFWKGSRDVLFLSFAVFFMVEGLYRVISIFVAQPNEWNPWTYSARLCTLLLILAAIVYKNYGQNR